MIGSAVEAVIYRNCQMTASVVASSPGPSLPGLGTRLMIVVTNGGGPNISSNIQSSQVKYFSFHELFGPGGQNILEDQIS